MKLLHACPPSRKRLHVDDTKSGRALERHRILQLVDGVVAGGMRRSDALRAIGLAKSTCHDWRKAFRRGGVRALRPGSTRPRTVPRRRWTDADDQAVPRLRKQYPFMGKLRLQAMLDR